MARWAWASALACSAVVAGCGGAASQPLADSVSVDVSGTPSASAPVITTTATTTPDTYADLPAVVRAAADPPVVDPNTLAPGTPIPATAIGARTPVVGSTLYGLADRGALESEQYPAISTDGGTSWRIDGPIFYRAAAEGASSASGIFVAGRLVFVPGVLGNFVRFTTDGGQHWFGAGFQNIIGSVTFRPGRLTVAVQSAPIITPSDTFSTRNYVSTDNGRTWYLQPTNPAGIATYGGPNESAHY